MKKLFLSLAVVAMLLPSCKKINEALDSLDGRLDKLEQETLPSIDEQIAAINVSLDNLNAMDKELKGYIDGLTATATNLQEQINTTNTKIDEVKAELKNDITTTEDELKGEIETAKANVIAQLEAAKTELENELATINATIATLKAKDAELDGKIANLQTYVDTELGKTTDWVSATFATLEQYNALVSEVATVKEQIKAINESISNLETKLTTKINEDIATAVSTLNADIQQKVKDITEAYTAAVKTAKEEITAAYTTAIQTAINALDASLKAWVGEQLSNYYTIAQVDAMLATMAQEMNGKLEAQKAYLEGLINELSAALTKSIADNKVLIDALREDITSLQGTSAEQATKIAENATAIAQNSQAIIENATAISKNGDNIEANEKLIDENKTFIEENTKVIAENKSAIDALKSSALTSIAKNATDITQNASNIAKNAALISQNATAITNNQLAILQNATDILQLQQNLATAKSEITEAYKKAISDAINTNNGVIDTKIATEVSTINKRIDNEVGTINSAITALTTRVTTLENEIAAIKQQIADVKEDVAKLLARIQSVSYIPTYEDGKATVNYDGVTSCISLDFEVSPKDAVSELAKVWQSAITVKAIYTQTRAVSFIDMPIEVFEADASSGVISLRVSGENLSQSFFDGVQTASARLSISDGNSSVTSEYIALDIQTILEYTTSDSQIVVPNNDYSVISNTYTNGVGKIVFSGRLTKINEYFCQRCTTLTSVTIPASVKIIGVNAFQGCSELSVVNMLSAPPGLEGSVFSSVASNCKIYVPIEYISIYKSSKSWSAYKSKIYDPAGDTKKIFYTSSDDSIVSPCNVSAFGGELSILDNSYVNGQGVITFDGEVSTIGNDAFRDCITLTSITIPNSVSSIGRYAFYGCSSLTKVGVINCSVGSLAFGKCNNLKCVYFGENAKITSRSFGYLSEIYFTCTTPPEDSNMWDDENVEFYVSYDDNTKIYVPLAAIDTYKTTGYWSDLSHLYVAY